ncbi:SapC family protein [Aliamphritea ceti]|uniref:SapC family protein n=1 Tax=Aliamphritea ceti TaxID=1524258 RepID=UPI0021C45DA5|nr:SapC family protein [Aliamphritea ceti]
MSVKKPLFYNKITALSHRTHGACYLDNNVGFHFAKEANSVPVGVNEFASACHSFPIVFLLEDNEAVPIIVLAIQANLNQWVSAEGEWSGQYIPAYIRRYPFIAVRTDESELTLCIDEKSDKLNRDGRGIPLFEGEKPSEFLKQILKFTEAFEAERDRNQMLSALLQELDLLEPAQLNAKPEAERTILSGFWVVSRARLEQLDQESVARLHKAGALELIYQHLLSLKCFQQLKLEQKQSDNAIAEGAA